jgi:hypothetical protein
MRTRSSPQRSGSATCAAFEDLQQEVERILDVDVLDR